MLYLSHVKNTIYLGYFSLRLSLFFIKDGMNVCFSPTNELFSVGGMFTSHIKCYREIGYSKYFYKQWVNECLINGIKT